MALPTFYSFTKQWHSKPYDAIALSRPELSAVSKNVVVTGAGSGIGRAVAIAFAEAGASSVALLGRRADRLTTTAELIGAKVPKATVLCNPTDILDRRQLEQVFVEIVAKVGKPHILVNNAATLPDTAPIAKAEAQTLQSTFSINVFGALNAAQVFLDHAGPEPVLLNINSGISHMAPLRSMGVYAASKAANAKIFDYLCLESPHLHLVNVQPGVVNTEMNREGKVQTQDEPELPGQFCVWLASPEAKFLRGKFVWVNWDVEELKERAGEIANSKLLTILLNGVPM